MERAHFLIFFSCVLLSSTYVSETFIDKEIENFSCQDGTSRYLSFSSHTLRLTQTGEVTAYAGRSSNFLSRATLIWIISLVKQIVELQECSHPKLWLY